MGIKRREWIGVGSHFGGSDGEVAYDLKRDPAGKYYLCGYTLSKDFPVVNALFPTSMNGGVDAFVAILNPGHVQTGIGGPNAPMTPTTEGLI